MAALPSISVTFNAGTLSPAAANPNIAMVVGPTSAPGTPGTVFAFSQPNAIATTIGDGPAQFAAARLLADNGGTINVVPVVASIAGTLSALTSGSGEPAVAWSGAPYNSYVFSAQITTAGALGVAQFTYSLDGGVTPSPSLPVVGSYTLTRTGVTLTFPTASYVVGQQWNGTAQAPQMTTTDLALALSPITSSFVPSAPVTLYVANDTFAAASGSALFSTLGAFLATAQGPNYLRFIQSVFMPTGGPNSNGNSVTAAATAATAGTFNFSVGQVASLVAERVSCVAADPFMGYGAPLVPFAQELADIELGISPSTDPAWVGLGGNDAYGQNGVGTTWDETVNGNVYAAQNIIAPRTLPLQGSTIFPNQGLLKQPAGSSFEYVHWGRPLMLAATVVAQAIQKYLNYTVPTKTDGSGQIQSIAANNIVDDIQGQLNSELINVTNDENGTGYCSAVQFSVNRENNVLTTSTLQTQVAMVPFGTLATITISMGFAAKV